jgi:hypothetical protein
MLRLRADLGVNLAGATIIVDLMERLERLDAELTRLRGQGWMDVNRLTEKTQDVLRRAQSRSRGSSTP